MGRKKQLTTAQKKQVALQKVRKLGVQKRQLKSLFPKLQQAAEHRHSKIGTRMKEVCDEKLAVAKARPTKKNIATARAAIRTEINNLTNFLRSYEKVLKLMRAVNGFESTRNLMVSQATFLKELSKRQKQLKTQPF